MGIKIGTKIFPSFLRHYVNHYWVLDNNAGELFSTDLMRLYKIHFNTLTSLIFYGCKSTGIHTSFATSKGSHLFLF